MLKFTRAEPEVYDYCVIMRNAEQVACIYEAERRRKTMIKRYITTFYDANDDITTMVLVSAAFFREARFARTLLASEI